jgi:hypothetical protein
MDHEKAIEIRAAERYCSGELSEGDRDQFEEHFFLCRECAEDVRWEQIFAANTKAVLLEQAREPGWRERLRAWLSPLQLQPALMASALVNAVLLIGVGYLSFSVVPGLRSQLQRSYTPQLTSAVVVPTTVRARVETIAVPRHQKLASLSFAVPQPYPTYTYEIRQEGGGIHITETVPAPAANPDELLLTIPLSGLTPGSYEVVLRGIEKTNRASEIGRHKLQLE